MADPITELRRLVVERRLDGRHGRKLTLQVASLLPGGMQADELRIGLRDALLVLVNAERLNVDEDSLRDDALAILDRIEATLKRH